MRRNSAQTVKPVQEADWRKANDAVGALGDTVSAIQTALAGGGTTISQAFAASPSCEALRQG